MLEYQESGVKTASGHRISFSIIDILDPKKFISTKTHAVLEKEPTSSSENTEFRSLEEQRNGKETPGHEESLSICKNIGEGIWLIITTPVRIISEWSTFEINSVSIFWLHSLEV